MEPIAGCWTCQLRRINCQNGRPLCTNCKDLLLPCEGYGRKPEWMDGGERETRYRGSIEAIVQETSRRMENIRKKKRTAMEVETRQSSMNASFRTATTSSGAEHTTLPSPATTCCISPTALCTPTRRHQQLSICDSPSPDPPMLEILPSSEFSETPASCSCGSPSCYECMTEAEIWMRYMMQVFGIQFPQYGRGSVTDDLGWLHILFQSSVPFRYSTLSLGAYRREDRRCGKSPKDLHTSYSYNILALQAVQERLNRFTHHVEEDQLMLRIEVIASVLQLAFFEIFEGNLQKCHMHTNMACKLMLDLLGDARSSYTVGEGFGSFEQLAIAFLLSVLTWSDLMYSVLLRSTPVLIGLHNTLLENSANAKSISGCGNWVALAAFQVCQLEEWKMTRILAGNLSNVELVSRALDLNDYIHQKLVSLEEDDELRVSPWEMNQEYTITTKIFAYATLIYLHVVVSGAQTNVPEIQTAVVESVKQLMVLAPRELSLWFAWPLCIIGSMASVEYQDFFMKLAMSFEEGDLRYRTFCCVLDVWKECWRSRRNGLHSWVDWTSSIQSFRVREPRLQSFAHNSAPLNHLPFIAASEDPS